MNDVDEEAINDVNEELDIGSADDMDLQREAASKEVSNEKSKSDSDGETSGIECLWVERCDNG